MSIKSLSIWAINHQIIVPTSCKIFHWKIEKLLRFSIDLTILRKILKIFRFLKTFIIRALVRVFDSVFLFLHCRLLAQSRDHLPWPETCSWTHRDTSRWSTSASPKSFPRYITSCLQLLCLQVVKSWIEKSKNRYHFPENHFPENRKKFSIFQPKILQLEGFLSIGMIIKNGRK